MFISSNDVGKTLTQLEELKKQYPELQINSYEQSLKNQQRYFIKDGPYL